MLKVIIPLYFLVFSILTVSGSFAASSDVDSTVTKEEVGSIGEDMNDASPESNVDVEMEDLDKINGSIISEDSDVGADMVVKDTLGDDKKTDTEKTDLLKSTITNLEAAGILNWLKIPFDHLSNFVNIEDAITVGEEEKPEDKVVEKEKAQEGKATDKSADVNVMAVKKKIEERKEPTVVAKQTSGMKSLMYTEYEFASISDAISAYKKGVRYEDVVASAEAEAREAREAFPEGGIVKEVLESANAASEYSIYLNSIIYSSPSSWAVWLNGERISSGEKHENGLNVVLVTNDEVDILWKISLAKWNILFPGSNTNSLKINENNEVEKRFKLRVNQTYLPLTDEIIEGKRK